MDEKWKRFDSQELMIARNASISRVARELGYTPKKLTAVWSTLEEHDSVIIKNDRNYSRNSVTAMNGKKEGGTAIDFVRNFTGITDMVEIVQYLCELEGYHRTLDEQEKSRRLRAIEERNKLPEGKEKIQPLQLPAQAQNYKVLYAYLIKTRKLDQDTVDYFVHHNYMYESREPYFKKGRDGEYLLGADGRYIEAYRHNIVFLGTNKNGEVRFASKRGTLDDYGFRYRGNVTGSDMSCGFQVNAPGSTDLYVFEAPLDLMSYCELTGDFDQTNKLALSTVSDKALIQYLKEHEDICHLNFCLDHDYAGMKAMCLLTCKYLGYHIQIEKIEPQEDPQALQAGEDVVLLRLHPDEEVYNNKELKESDTEALGEVLNRDLLQLQSRTKYEVDYESPAYGKDFNEELQQRKEADSSRNVGKRLSY